MMASRVPVYVIDRSPPQNKSRYYTIEIYNSATALNTAVKKEKARVSNYCCRLKKSVAIRSRFTATTYDIVLE